MAKLMESVVVFFILSRVLFFAITGPPELPINSTQWQQPQYEQSQLLEQSRKLSITSKDDLESSKENLREIQVEPEVIQLSRNFSETFCSSANTLADNYFVAFRFENEEIFSGV